MTLALEGHCFIFSQGQIAVVEKETEIRVMNIHLVIPCVLDRWTNSSLEIHAWSQTKKYIIHSNSKRKMLIKAF